MPPRKEPKESVVYPASKRKAPAFKPQRPSKVPRIARTESESSRSTPTLSKPAKKPTAAVKSALQKARIDDGDESEDGDGPGATAGADSTDSDEELDDDPLAAKPRPAKKLSVPAATKEKPPARGKPPVSISSQEHADSSPPPTRVDVPPLTQLSDPTQIPQPLLVRLLHEAFADKSTKIDKHAIQVLQKYMEVFVREAIARTAASKKEAAHRGEIDVSDVGWLELEDLEKVAGGMMLDF